jgi:gas vesicle structural protein
MPCARVTSRLAGHGYPRGQEMAVERHATISAIDVVDRILDKGIVIDYEARISILGVDLCTTIEARVVIASIDTFIHYAPALRNTARMVDLLPNLDLLPKRDSYDERQHSDRPRR